jgi:hypothetical protein
MEMTRRCANLAPLLKGLVEGQAQRHTALCQKKGRTREIPLLKVVTEPVAILQAWKDETVTQWK